MSRSRSRRKRSFGRRSGNSSNSTNNDYDGTCRANRFTIETKVATILAERAWLYITILAVGSMITRGVATPAGTSHTTTATEPDR